MRFLTENVGEKRVLECTLPKLVLSTYLGKVVGIYRFTLKTVYRHSFGSIGAAGCLIWDGTLQNAANCFCMIFIM